MPARLKKIPLTIFQRFFRTETLGGLVLLGFGLAALAIANSPLSAAYNHLWEIPLTLGIAPHELSLSLHDWINDGLMAVFFLLVGLEIKRELLAGELSSVQQAALPIACAIGGMVVPALIYLIFNLRGLGAHGWGIPMATDIAFALGALNLDCSAGANRRKSAADCPGHRRRHGGGACYLTFLFAGDRLECAGRRSGDAARVDWIQSNRYSSSVAVPAGRGCPMVFCSCLRRARHDRRRCPRLHHSYGVLTGKGQQETVFALERTSGGVTAPGIRLEHALHNFSAFVVMPLFAFANAGVKIDLSLQHAEIGFGILAGLLFGKPLGIMMFALIAVKTGIARLPQAVNWRSLLGYGFLAGIGFTMSLFIAMLAFDDTGSVNAAKRGIIAASLLAGVAGAVMLRAGRPLRDVN